MGTKVTINSITAGHGAAGDINSNDTTLADAFDNTLSRDGTSPNQMTADIDLNSNDLLNAKDVNATNVNTTNLKLNGVTVVASNLSGATASQIANIPSGNIAATELQAAINELDLEKVAVFDDLAALRLATAGSGVALIKGYSFDRDGGGGLFHWNTTSTAADDDGITIKITSVTVGRWIRLYSGRINIRWFGAKGDAVTDDAAALLSAITAAEGNTVFIPEGIYLIGSDTQLPSDLILEGEGVKTQITTDTGGGGIGQIYANTKKNITIRDIQFETNGSISFVPTFTLCTDILLERCTFKGLQGTTLSSVGLRSQGTVGFTVSKCKFSDFDSSIYLDKSGATNSDDVRVLHSIFEQTVDGTNNNPTSVYQFNCDNLLVDGCIFKDIRAGGGAPIAGYSVYEGDGTAVNLVVTNCVSNQTVAAFPHVLVQASNVKNCSVTKNYFKSVGSVKSQLFNGGGENASIFISKNYSKNGSIFTGRAGGVATAPSFIDISENNFDGQDSTDIQIFLGVLSTNYNKTVRVSKNTFFGSKRGAIYVGQCEYIDISKNKFWNMNTDNNTSGANQLQDAIAFELINPIRGIVSDNEFLNDTTSPQGYMRHGVSANATTNNTVAVLNNQYIGMIGANTLNLADSGFVPNFGANTNTFEAEDINTSGTITSAGIISIDDTTDSSSTVTGSIHTDGGLGVAKDVYLGGTLTVAGNSVSVTATTGIRNRIASTDRISISTSATGLFTLGLSGASVGASAVMVIVNGYDTATTSNSFSELVVFVNGVAPTVVTGSTVNRGSPQVRTYTANGTSLELAMAANTYNVAVSSIEQAC